MSKLFSTVQSASSWFQLLRRWQPAVGPGSWPNLVRLIRSSWVSSFAAAETKRALRLRVRDCRQAVFARLYTSDISVLEEIFVRRVYADLTSKIPNLQYVIDCGANVGYSSLYFLRHHSVCRVLAIEPDEENFVLCCRNLAAELESGRAHVLRAAAWSGEEDLRVNEGGEEWARTVHTADAPAASCARLVRGHSLGTLVQLSGFPYVDILKIDIEGAELEVFQNGIDSGLLNRVRVVAIELHGEACERTFYRALDGKPFSFQQSGAYVIATNHDFSADRTMSTSSS